MKIYAFILLGAAVSACTATRPTERSAGDPPALIPAAPLQPQLLGGTPADIPHATLYRMSGDYADHVAVTLGPDGTLQSYPAPSDIYEGCTPLPVGDGLWLDRRGISARSVFTRYTFAQYAALGEAPSPQTLLDSIIPGARVTAVYTLDITAAEAAADPAAVREYVRTHPAKFR